MPNIKKIRTIMEDGGNIAVDKDTGYNYSNPVFVGIESTTRCNLACPICSRDYLRSIDYDFGDMPLATFKKIVPFIKTSKLVFLSKCGEPLLASGIMEMIRICREFKCNIAMSSNGSLMDENISEQLIDNGLDWIELSVDGIESFYNIRGFEPDVFINNIKSLNRIKEKKGKTNPSVTFCFVAMHNNLKELSGVVRLAASLGVERIFVHPLRIYYSCLEAENIYNDPTETLRVFNACKDEAARLGVNLVIRQTSLIKDEGDLVSPDCFCLAPFDRFFIDQKGFASDICCGSRKLGGYEQKFNVNTTPVEEIWNCEEYRKIRLELLNKTPSDICKDCNFISGTYENQVSLIGNPGHVPFSFERFSRIRK